ncbi:GapA-binding peptide SR1P [Cohnella sp. CFH 77786]|uniref:GapA-binding peptide SR1P n=1 Tax=Cohnella sp. CFH 77786 TaxID=2662265 RepID=UPI001C60D143|nr:GapA-binding peptide SR1P [Cohnella sp. CFH 77786]MBW5445301.1 GapA-binding peptide SR1P [Cohnella sp. CFH 77786]
MSRSNGLAPTPSGKPELGALICRVCNEVVATLPTNGVKKIYGVCGKKACMESTIRSGG